MPSDSNRETRMPPLRQILAVLALGASLASQTAVAAECPYPGKVVFAGLNWESGMFTTDLLRYVLEKGYGCETDALPGNTVTMENALRQNDIQVTGEQWAGRSPVWRAAEEAGEVFSVGETVKGATEGWWVPEYLVKGDPQRGIEAKAPELRSVADLPRYKALFRDPEEPAKGRFYNCPTGWTCEIVNSQKLKAYRLQDSYTNFRTGTGPALDAAISAAFRRGEPVLFYYWSPTPLMGRSSWCNWKSRRSARRPGPPCPIRRTPTPSVPARCRRRSPLAFPAISMTRRRRWSSCSARSRSPCRCSTSCSPTWRRIIARSARCVRSSFASIAKSGATGCQPKSPRASIPP